MTKVATKLLSTILTVLLVGVVVTIGTRLMDNNSEYTFKVTWEHPRRYVVIHYRIDGDPSRIKTEYGGSFSLTIPRDTRYAKVSAYQDRDGDLKIQLLHNGTEVRRTETTHIGTIEEQFLIGQQ